MIILNFEIELFYSYKNQHFSQNLFLLNMPLEGSVLHCGVVDLIELVDVMLASGDASICHVWPVGRDVVRKQAHPVLHQEGDLWNV